MKILQVCKKFPFPAKDGETIAIFNCTKSFVQLGHEVTILGMSTPKHTINKKDIPEWFSKMVKYDIVYVDTSLKVVDAFKNLFKKTSYNIDRFYCKNFENKLIENLRENQYDIIQLEGLYLTPYLSVIRKYSNAPVAMRSHNVEFEIWERISENIKSGAKKVYVKFLAERMKSYETNHVNHYDFLIPITHRDGEKFKYLGCEIPVYPLPAGVDFEALNGHAKQYQSAVNNNLPKIFFLGAMDWIPNQHGVTWFLEKVWKKVIKHEPNAEIFIAGRNFPSNMFEQNSKNIHIIGEVENAIEFMNDKSIMVVPLFSGSGMRIKIIEAMAIGKTVISTSIGAEGIDYENSKNIIIADNEISFSEAILKCLREVSYAENIAKNGMLLIKDKYNNEILTKGLIDLYKQNVK